MRKLGLRIASTAFLVGTFFSVVAYSAPPPLPEGNTDIAVRYPNDAGIGADPAVLFADGFESYTQAGQLTSSGNYNNLFQGGNIAIDTATFFGDTKALRMRMPQSGVEELGAGVIDVKAFKAESAADVAERIRAILKHVPPEKLWLNPDCGFWETPRWVVKQKLAALVDGAQIVRMELGG